MGLDSFNLVGIWSEFGRILPDSGRNQVGIWSESGRNQVGIWSESGRIGIRADPSDSARNGRNLVGIWSE